MSKDEPEPDAVHYFRKAVEGLEDEMAGPSYYLARGLLRLAESLATQGSPMALTGNKGILESEPLDLSLAMRPAAFHTGTTGERLRGRRRR